MANSEVLEGEEGVKMTMPLTRDLFLAHKSVFVILALANVIVFYLNVYKQAKWKYSDGDNEFDEQQPIVIDESETKKSSPTTTTAEETKKIAGKQQK